MRCRALLLAARLLRALADLAAPPEPVRVACPMCGTPVTDAHVHGDVAAVRGPRGVLVGPCDLLDGHS